MIQVDKSDKAVNCAEKDKHFQSKKHHFLDTF